jgi:hypothetical protein
MKPVSLKVAITNALLFIRDARIPDVPDVDYGDGSSVWSIPTCVVITCLVDSEGDTGITIGDTSEVKPSNMLLLFDGTLETPSRKLMLEIVPDEKILEVSVPFATNRIRIWTDGRHRLAETVVIGIG